MGEILINGSDITLEQVILVSRFGYRVKLTEEASNKVIASRDIVEKIVKEGRVVYGITTGFGKFSDITISEGNSKILQRNLIISHCCGYGESFNEETVRAMMLLRVNALAKGYSGIRLSTLETLIDMLNKGVHPLVYEKGSLGASGDLAPLAHMVLPLIGEGEAIYKGETMQGKEAMKKAGINIVELTSKEGLALINGTCVMTAVGAIALYEAINIMKNADVAASLSLEALRGIKDAFDPRIHEVRPHRGQLSTARNILNLTKGSELLTYQGEIRVQDAYTLRCIPQVHGASKDAINYVKNALDIEMNSVTDNPIIISEDEIISGGNFHGQPMAISFDFLGIALAEIGNISERRLERLINYQLNDLPPFLIKNGGLNSGFMITQYGAASLVSENKVLAHPASVDSIPSSANQEDHVSMGTIAARKARDIINNVSRVIATEIMAACQAIDFREGFKMGIGTKIAYDKVRENISFIEEDKIMYRELDKMSKLVNEGELVKNIEREIIIEV